MSRAKGAMFLIAFGALWLGSWWWFAERERLWLLALIAGAAVVLFAMALRIYRANRAAHSVHSRPEQARKTSRTFRIINAIQWALIVLGVNVLHAAGLGNWEVPFTILVVGVHFFPIARVFRYPPYYVTGALMVLLAVAYPFVSGAGPLSPVGLLGAGVILWATALWVVAPGKPRRSK